MRNPARRFQLALLVFAASGLLLAQKGPTTGTWKLNSAKSKFNPDPGPKAATLTIEGTGSSIKFTFDATQADDSHIGYEYTATEDDGKDYPVSGTGVASLLGGGDSVIVRHAGSNALGALFKKSGQVVATDKVAFSKDGKTLTLTSQGAGAKGQPVSSTTVWDKQ